MTQGRALALTPSDVNLPRPAVERGIAPETWNTLKQALYPGKSDQMVLLAFDYCRARGLDPIKKPVHIVKTWDPDQGGVVESIWEGINSHRVTASRTGAYAGQDEPEFGPEVTRALGGTQLTFPVWCQVTVYRMVEGQRCAFCGIIRWLETYSRRKDGTPTAQWIKRPYGQAAKCAEAEALRKAFPEETGGRPTAEEMDGHEYDGAVDVTPPRSAASRLDALEQAIANGAGGDAASSGGLSPVADYVGAELGLPPLPEPQLRSPSGEVLPADQGGLARFKELWLAHASRIDIEPDTALADLDRAIAVGKKLFAGKPKILGWLDDLSAQCRSKVVTQ